MDLYDFTSDFAEACKMEISRLNGAIAETEKRLGYAKFKKDLYAISQNEGLLVNLKKRITQIKSLWDV